jgi:UPF0716 family protein affecting phage T7 exclusion
VKFSIPALFAVIGLCVWLTWANWMGLVGFVGLFFTGSVLGTLVFKRYATQAQIKADLEARMHND